MECDKNQTFFSPSFSTFLPPELFFILSESHWLCVQKNVLPLKSHVAGVFSPVNEQNIAALPSYPLAIRWWLTLRKSSNLFLESAPRRPTAVISEWLDQICVLKSCNHLQTCCCWLRETFLSPELGSLAAVQSNLTNTSCFSLLESGGNPKQTDQIWWVFTAFVLIKIFSSLVTEVAG